MSFVTKYLAVCFCLLSLLTLEESFAHAKNIVWIAAQDLSHRLACYSDSLAHTPDLDQLAEERVLYTQAYATLWGLHTFTTFSYGGQVSDFKCCRCHEHLSKNLYHSRH